MGGSEHAGMVCVPRKWLLRNGATRATRTQLAITAARHHGLRGHRKGLQLRRCGMTRAARRPLHG